MNRCAYATDLSDAEWERLEPLLPKRFKVGRTPKWTLREIVNGVMYVLKTGCQWHLLPHEFPPYKTVFGYYRQWRHDGVWEQVNSRLREDWRYNRGAKRHQALPSSIVNP